MAVCGVALWIFSTKPYKLNRTDYDTCRRSTMITSYSKGPKKGGFSDDEASRNMYANMNGGKNAEYSSAINSLLENRD